jgi:thymidylate synthase (FAD)
MKYRTYEEVAAVDLISYSQPPPGCARELPQSVIDMIAFCARVSNPDNQSNAVTAPRLIEYLVRNKHWSPFEMVSVCLEITTTRDIARQMIRHWSLRPQEYSQRYADPLADLELVLRECRLQDPKNRQKSLPCSDEKLNRLWKDFQASHLSRVEESYRMFLDAGVAKEVVRCMLPEGNTVSRLYMNAPVRSWIHYLTLRLENGTQKEHTLIAQRCAEVISKVFPIAEFLEAASA